MLPPQRLVLVGSVLVDILLYIDRLPERGGDTLARRSIITSGGGMNVLVGATRLGLSTAYAGRVGDGAMGTQVMADLTANGIPLLLPRIQGEDSGFDIGVVESDAERTFITSPGAESRLRTGDLAAIPLQAQDAVYVSGYDLCYPISGAALEEWLPTLEATTLLILDSGPLVNEIPSERLARVLARTNIFTLNEREAMLLTGETDARTAASLLTQRIAPDSWVILRIGAQGCWLVGRNQPAQHIAARKTQAVDTTGAGDAHTAALVVRLAAGDDLSTAARIANIAAALAVERHGPATGPTSSELEVALQAMKYDGSWLIAL